MEKEIPINYVKWGLANKFDDCIELNEELLKYPKLHAQILKHELGHRNTNTFKQDFIHDISENKIKQKDLVSFMIKHPKSLTQLLPIYWSPKRKQFIYDLNMVLLYTITLIIIFVGFLLIR